jgi:hypothetical protein
MSILRTAISGSLLEVHNGHVAKREIFADVDLLAVRDHCDTLTAIGHEFSLLHKDRVTSLAGDSLASN